MIDDHKLEPCARCDHPPAQSDSWMAPRPGYFSTSRHLIQCRLCCVAVIADDRKSWNSIQRNARDVVTLRARVADLEQRLSAMQDGRIGEARL